MPERPGPGLPEKPEAAPLSPEERARVVRAAALRPLNVLVLVIGLVATPLIAWWMLPLTLVTYAALVALGARSPLFQARVLPGRESPAIGPGMPQDVSPERRARWLPRGETRQKVEATLIVYRKVVAAIEESDDVTRAVLGDTVPRLHATANHLVDVARSREKAAEVVEDLRKGSGATDARAENLHELEGGIQTADAEISETFEKFVDLRANIVRLSLESGDPTRAASLNTSLDELNARLEALSETMSSRGDS